jgi:hypothetical protein
MSRRVGDEGKSVDDIWRLDGRYAQDNCKRGKVLTIDGF